MKSFNASILPVRCSARLVPWLPALLSVAFVAGCSSDPGAASSSNPPTPTTLSHDFSDFTVKPGEEVLGLCRSWTLQNDSEFWVNSVELTQGEESHHSNWVYVPEDTFTGPDGVWKCSDRKYDIYSAMNVGGLLYAQSTQAAHEVQKFANGAAVRIPPHSRIISDVHLLNTTSETVTGHAKLTAYTLPESEVKVKLTSFHMEYDALNIAAHSSARFTGDCEIGADITKATGEPFNMKVYYVLPHTHTLATRFFANVLGGPHDGEAVIDIGAYNGEARGQGYDPPIDMAGSKGFRFGCEYANPLSTDVTWGFGSGEMCELVGFGDNAVYSQSRVNTGAPAGMDGAVHLFAGSCDTTVYDN